MTRSLKASLMTVLSVALTLSTANSFAAPKRGGSGKSSSHRSFSSRGSSILGSSRSRIQSSSGNRVSSSIRNASSNRISPRPSNVTNFKRKPTSNIQQFTPNKPASARIPVNTKLPTRKPQIGNLNGKLNGGLINKLNGSQTNKFRPSTKLGNGRSPLKLKDLSIREKLNKPFVPLGKFNGGKLHEVLKHKQVIYKTPGYQKCLKYAGGCGWFQKPHCGWWGNLATCWYHHHHGTYCPDYYWDHCRRYRCVYIACPATPEYAASYWYFGCDVVMVPGVGYGVAAVTPNSPAALAGIQQGDMITQVSGQSPEDDNLLATAVQQSGGQLNLTVLRDGSDDAEAMQIALQRIEKSSL